jgi:hypothetical protein
VIKRVHRENFEAYGYRRMWKALRREGEPVARCRVQRLMAANAIQGAKRRGRPWQITMPDEEALRRADLVQRASPPRAPRLWVCDFTYLRCWEGVVFFAVVIDVYSRRVVGWQLAAHMRTLEFPPTQIQTPAPPSATGLGSRGRRPSATARALRPLADGRHAATPDDGSRMTGDCHVRF